jgi:transposase InsO family protein
MDDSNDDRSRDRWAQLRFSIVGPLLSAPPARGELTEELEKLSRKKWRNPVTGEAETYAISTIEKWFYAARNADRDPIGALARQVRKDAGTHPSMTPGLITALAAQYGDHPAWTYQLHVDNLAVLAERDDLGVMPSYPTVRRYMKAKGLFPRKRLGKRGSPGAAIAEARLEQREVRSYESEHVNALWHSDFHAGSRNVLSADGVWLEPVLLGVLDDRSRLCCHAQWYLDETKETFVHGLSQALMKRRLPRAFMSDNGGPMTAAETEQGLEDLSIIHETTLPYSPYQNAKQESFWATVESRLMPMLENKKDLTLELLNEATQAWVELEYNHRHHSEIGTTPMRRYLDGPDVGRDCPGSEDLRRAFRMDVSRTQRRSDGTISVEGRRFELPSRYRHLERVRIRYARWDLRTVDLIDTRTRKVTCTLYPLDKAANGDGQRRTNEPICEGEAPSSLEASNEIAPLLRKLMEDYAASGLPPAYLPKPVRGDRESEEEGR